MNRTFVMAKPDAVERRLIGEIVGRLEAKGFTLVAADLRMVDKALAEKPLPAEWLMMRLSERLPSDAIIVLQVDQSERRWKVHLPDGISAGSKR